MKRNMISIRWKVFVYLLSFAAVLLGLLWLFQTVYLDSFYTAIKNRELKKALHVLEESLKSEKLSDKIQSISAEYSLCILIGDSEGNMLYSSEYLHNCPIHSVGPGKIRKYYAQCEAHGGKLALRHKEWNFGLLEKRRARTLAENPPKDLAGYVDEDFENKPLLNLKQKEEQNVTYAKLAESGEEKWLLMVNAELTPVDATVHTLRIQLVYISGMMLFLSLGIALLLARKITRPIVEISQSAKKLADGEYDVVFQGNSYREINQLSDTLNETARELGKAEGLQRELISNVSHDLRTPLTMITAYSEVMRDLPGENTPENIQIIIDETSRLTNLVNDMLDISKLQAGVMEMEARIYDLTESIQAVIARYTKLMEQEGYTISFCFTEHVWVKADEFKMYQVMYNLINNAIHYTGEDKQVLVRQQLEDAGVRIEVCDTGSGIEEKDIKYIWERYYKVDKKHKRAVSGTGLGLSIVKSILELHRAEYGVESQPDKGSVFWFVLPCYEG